MNHLSTEFSTRPDLKYPFKRGFYPPAAEPFEVADGVFWLYMPMPISLDHINLWLLRDGDGWVIVDSGLDSPGCMQVWDSLFESFLTPESVNRILLTHFHPDHIGLASWLAHRCNCKIWISGGEFNHYDSIINRDETSHSQAAEKFVKEIGFPPEFAATYMRYFSLEKKDPLKRVQRHMCEFIKGGDELQIGDYSWRVVMGNGHSPEHSCFYSEALETMISGDQALPRISSNISVYLSNRLQDPLGDWLDSCARLRDNIPSDTLVLPSHQEPFYGLDLRMQQLIDDHHAQLNRLRLGAVEALTAYQACSVLFDRELSHDETLMATGETLSHINYLWHRKELNKISADDNSVQYVSSK